MQRIILGIYYHLLPQHNKFVFAVPDFFVTNTISFSLSTMNLDLSPGKCIEIRPQTPLRHFCCPKRVEEEEKRCGCISCRVPCGVTEEVLEKAAQDKVNNRIFFMGLTDLGYQKPIRESVNPRFIDKYQGRPQMDQFVPKKGDTNIDYRKLAEDFRNIDIYTGLVDGKHYGRFERLYYQKRRHTRSPYGM